MQFKLLFLQCSPAPMYTVLLLISFRNAQSFIDLSSPTISGWRHPCCNQCSGASELIYNLAPENINLSTEAVFKSARNEYHYIVQKVQTVQTVQCFIQCRTAQAQLFSTCLSKNYSNLTHFHLYFFMRTSKF